jgi:3-methyladenine DNA glycosylase AlkC
VRFLPAWELVLIVWLASKVVNTEAEGATLLEAVTRTNSEDSRLRRLSTCCSELRV